MTLENCLETKAKTLIAWSCNKTLSQDQAIRVLALGTRFV